MTATIKVTNTPPSNRIDMYVEFDPPLTENAEPSVVEDLVVAMVATVSRLTAETRFE